MVVARRLLSFALLAAAGLAAAAAPAAAQTDVIRGRVLTGEGLPLQNVRVTATSIPGNVTREARTNREGSYQIAFINGPHDYIMGFSLIGYAFKQFEIKQVADEQVLIADARLSVVQLDTVVTTASNQQRVSRNSQTPDVSGAEQTINNLNLPPELQGDLAAMAASLPGVTLIPGLDGQPDGFSVLGLGADQNTTTLNGQSFNSSSLPRDAQVQTSLSTSTLDVSRGGFSGANQNLSAASGSNFRTRGTSFVFNAPALEWTDRAAQAVGTEYTNLSLGGVVSGPISYNKSFFSLSYQFGRNSRDNATLLNTNALGLLTAGVAYDSVQHLLRHSEPARAVADGRRAASVAPQRQRLGLRQPLLLSTDLEQRAIDRGDVQRELVAAGSGRWQRDVAGVGERRADQLGRGTPGAPHRVHRQHAERDGGVGESLAQLWNTVPASAGGHRAGELRPSRRRERRLGPDLWRRTGIRLHVRVSGTPAFKTRCRGSTPRTSTGSSWRRTSTTAAPPSTNPFNRLGTFSFNSLSDLANGVPASFSRSLSAYDRTVNLFLAGASIGDSYRRNQDLQIQYGLRVDGAHYATAPIYNPDIDHLFGLRNDHVPNPISISPRIGFQKTLGQAPEIFAFTGAQRAPRAIVRVNVGMFSNNPTVGLISSALDNTGLASGAQQISCVGPAAPIPNWSAYENDPGSIPTTCADGTLGTPFATSAPNVYLVSPDYRTQRSVRANASWNGSLLDGRFSAGITGTYSLNLNQQRSFDLNFKPSAQFSLDDGRPVFAQAANIVPTTGAIAPGDAHVTTAYTHVYETRSDLQSRSSQIQLSLSPIPHGPTKFTWSATYTYLHIRELVSGFQSTAANPLDLLWSTNGQGPHQISYNLRYNLFNAAAITWSGSFRSGNHFTPMIAGDVNGDGYSNDRAFVYNPSIVTDTALASGMRQLLANASPATRDCLQSQIGHIAARNSCLAPWSSNASIQLALDRAKFRMPQRANVSFSLNNPLGAADLALNGSGHLKGWGQSYAPDQSLLYVRGFDQTTQRFTYQVNQRFGATNPALVVLRSPVVFTTQVRVDVGAMRERQTLGIQLGQGRTLPGTRAPEALFRAIGAGSISNPMATIIRQQDSLHLTVVQADSLAAMNRRYTYRSDSLWAPVARYLVKLPERYDEGEAYGLYLHTRRAQIDMITQLAPTIRALLTPEQLRKIPQLTLNTLDPLYLASVRDGTSLYVGGIAPFFGAPVFIGGGAAFAEFTAVSISR